jgi:PAS domain S-box-containing protein
MKIKERLKLNTWISLGAIVLMMVTLGWSFREVYRADRNVHLIDEMRKAAYERTFLRNDYLLNRSEPAKIQWHAQSETLRALLESASEMFTGTEDRALLQKARKNFDATFSSFSAILEKEKQKEPDDRKKLAFSEAESTLISQVFLNAYALNDSIVRLYESSRGASITARDRGIIFIIVFVMGGIIAIVINSIFISGIVAKRVTALHDGVEIIGGGNLEHRIDDVGDDELSDLARASNQMVAKQKASQEYSESIINTVREPLIALDQDLRVVTASRSFYEFFKVKPEDTVGQLIYDLGNRQWDIPKLRELLEDILPKKVAFDNYEVEHNFTGVGKRIMLLNARQIQRALGKEKIILLAIEDITERKEIEAGLEKTRKELAVIKKTADEVSEFAENVINTVREPLIALDQDLRVVKVSSSFYEFFKVEPEETMGQLIYDLGNKQWDIPKLRELLENILPRKATLENYEVEHEFSAIGRRVMLLNARQIQRVWGKERIILLAIEDITERKEIEAGLKKAHEELESFSYSVSHDLRAPLRGIDGWSLALLEDYKDKLDEQGREYIDLVRSETQIMGRLIDDLLMFSRQNRADMNQQPLDMTAMAQAIISRLQQQNPTLQADFIVQPGLKALGDNNLIEIALKNLLDNAAKFSSKTSRAVIEFGQVEKEGRKAFFVRDNGVGFDMAYSNKLFGVFRRLHKASEFPGTGIGLASVQRIINRHGGRIWAEAVVNEGATFYFTLKEAI